MANYLPDLNKFQLAGPPQWWLRQLHDFDNSLVVVPSRQGFYYRLAQRRKLNLANKITNEALFQESDTKMLAGYSLVPVTTIIATANWSNPYLFEELRRRAPWRMGGAEATIKQVEDQEWKAELDRVAATNEHLDYLGKDAWNYYNMKLGLRSNLYSPKTKPSNSRGPLLKMDQHTSPSRIPQKAGAVSGGSIFLP